MTDVRAPVRGAPPGKVFFMLTHPIQNSDRMTGNTRMALVLRMEWTLLVFRYLTYLLLAVLSVTTADEALVHVLIVVGASALAHNVFTHWVLYTRRYRLFVSPVNFTLYLGRMCLLAGMTGGETSPFAPFFIFLVIGYHIYAPRALNTLWITLVVCAAYSFTVMARWLAVGMNWMYMPLYINLAYIAFCGYIMNILARVMHTLEQNAHRQATALSSSESTLRAILNHTAHPIVVYGENDLITEANESACNFLGIPREHLRGLRFQSFIFDDGSLTDSMAELHATGALHQERLVITADQAERNVYMHVHSFLRENKRFYVALFHDITHQKEFQEKNRMATLKLEEANRELQRVVELRAAFYANVANRLRSPLAAMLGFTDMLLDEQMGDLNAEQRNALHSCRSSIMRIFAVLDEAFTPEPPGQDEISDKGRTQSTSSEGI